MKALKTAAVVVLFSIAALNTKAQKKKMTTELDKFSYSLGMDIGNNIMQANLDTISIELLSKGLADVLGKKATALTKEEAQTIIRDHFSKVQAEAGSKKTAEGQAFLAENAKKPGITTTASGLQYEVITMGTGAKPTLNDQVTTHYTGKLINGTTFDSSVDRGEPATFPVSGVIAGWTEALQLMPTGSKWRLYIPSNLAYGERGAGGSIGPNETLIFDIELISIGGK